jgi:hypothetical protein
MTTSSADELLGVFGPVEGETEAQASMRIMGMLAVTLEGHREAMQRAADNDPHAGKIYAPIQPIVLPTIGALATGTVAGVTTFASAELWGPKTGYAWAIQRFAAFGLAAQGLSQEFTIPATTSPTTFQTLLTIPGLVPGEEYDVTATATTAGTTGTPEVNNFRLNTTGGTGAIVPSLPGASVTTTLTYVAGSSGNLLITTGGNTPTTGAIYSGTVSISATPDLINIFRGQPAPQNFLNNLTSASPEWRPGHTSVILQPGDFLTAQGTGLVGSPIAINFDAVIMPLWQLSDFIS